MLISTLLCYPKLSYKEQAVQHIVINVKYIGEIENAKRQWSQTELFWKFHRKLHSGVVICRWNLKIKLIVSPAMSDWQVWRKQKIPKKISAY